MDSELLRIVGGILVVIGAILKLVFKTRRPPIGQIIMICFWLGISLIGVGYIWLAVS